MRPRPAKSRFTLIELLIVVAIIAILASILLPALGSARRAAKAVACMNNQKQMYIALELYADDHSGWTPTPYDNATPDIPARQWLHLLQTLGYVGMPWQKLQQCPLRPDSYATGFTNHLYSALNDGTAEVNSEVYYNLHKSYRPTELYLFIEMAGGYWYSANAWHIGYPHDERCNIIYADGHGEAHKYGSVVEHTWARKLPWYNKPVYDPSAGIQTQRGD